MPNLPRPALLFLLMSACEVRRVVVPGVDGGASPTGPCPRLHVSAETLSWREVSTDGTTPQSIGITNLCSGQEEMTLAITLLPSSSEAFSFVVGQTHLAPGESTVLVASFSPRDLERHSGIIEVLSDAPEEGLVQIALDGQAVADGDGDGHDAQAVGGDDCNDTDPDIHPDADEIWADGLDNDCDGSIDQLGPEAAVGWLRGQPGEALGYRSSASTGDLTGDGVPDIIAGGWNLGEEAEQGAVYVLDGIDHLELAGSIDGYALAIIEGAAAESRTGSLDPIQGDHDGDGVADLYMVGSDLINADDGNRAGAVYLGGPALSGPLSPAEASITLSGADSLTSITGLGSIDFDGDGLDELFLGDWYDGWTFSGRVYGLLGATVAEGGDFPLGWAADLTWQGDNAEDRLGCALGGGDLDGDGYDDLLMSSPQADLGGTNTGSVFLVHGAAEPAPSGTIEDLYDAQIHGEVPWGQLGWMARPIVADLDGDGAAELVVSSPTLGRVHLWLGTTALEGVISGDDADIEILGESADLFGLTLARGDADGDGLTDLVVGAPDASAPEAVASSADQEGEVYIFTGRDMVLGSLGSSAATVALHGVSSGDLFGLSLGMADLDGDHQDELLVAGPGAGTSQQGYLWIFDGG